MRLFDDNSSAAWIFPENDMLKNIKNTLGLSQKLVDHLELNIMDKGSVTKEPSSGGFQ